MYNSFKALLVKKKLPFTVLKGSHESRMEIAKQVLNNLTEMKSLTEADFEQFKNSNRSVELIQRQYEFLVHGTAFQKEIKAATLGDGIQKLNPQTEAAALDKFNKHKDSISWMKFVPASGAASRMFAPFFAFLEAKEETEF